MAWKRTAPCSAASTVRSSRVLRSCATACKRGSQLNGRLERETKMQQLKDVMSHDVKVVFPDATIKDAARQMRDGDFGLLPVGENDRMIGTISDRDIAIRAVADGRSPDTKVRDVMSEDVLWA